MSLSAGSFLEHLENHGLHVVLLVAEVVEEELQRRVRDLELRSRELEPEGALVPANEVVLVGHKPSQATNDVRERRGRPPPCAAASSQPVPHDAVSRLLGPTAAGLAPSRASAASAATPRARALGRRAASTPM